MYPDLPSVIHRALLADRREPTGLLHCSSHSWQPLRFTQLSQVIKSDETDYGSLMTMKLGTLTHDWLEEVIASDSQIDILGPDWSIVGTEIDLTDSLPEGWTGTCDYLFHHVPTGTYVVGDLKTIKPEGMAFLGNRPKPEHVTQVSCYHSALQVLFPESTIGPKLFVCYLPKGKTAKQETVLPRIITAPAIDRAIMWRRLSDIKLSVDLYVREYERTGDLDNKCLAPMPAPELKVGWNKAQGVWDVVARPSWTEEYIGAAYGEELCPRTPSEKAGHFTLDLHYVPRRGIIQMDDPPMPSADEIKRRQNA